MRLLHFAGHVLAGVRVACRLCGTHFDLGIFELNYPHGITMHHITRKEAVHNLRGVVAHLWPGREVRWLCAAWLADARKACLFGVAAVSGAEACVRGFGSG